MSIEATLSEWRVEAAPIGYPEALAAMTARVEAIYAGTARELIWLVEHPPLYTAGTSAQARDLLDAARLPVFTSGRGGRYTYHGPGQRVVYAMLDLNRRGRDVRRYVAAVEAWAVAALGLLDVRAFTAPGRVGIWVVADGAEAKIGAIGIRVRRWVTAHGLALNVNPDLDDFRGITPCGLTGFGVTSLAALGCAASMADVDSALQASLPVLLDGIAAVEPLVAMALEGCDVSG